MCLDMVDKETTATEGEGWRVVKVKNHALFPTFYDGRLRTRRWLTDSNEGTIFVIPGLKYKAGFHLFTNRGDAEVLVGIMAGFSGEYGVRRVSYRATVATGYQYQNNHKLRVIVAREIYIHPKGI